MPSFDKSDKVDELIIEALTGASTKGINVDSLYYNQAEAKFYIIEFLKCDNKKVTPLESHPNRYMTSDFMKFHTLWMLKEKIGGRLILINYEDLPHAQGQKRSDRMFKIFEMTGLDIEAKECTTKDLHNFNTFNEFKTWFVNFNNTYQL